MPHVGHAIAGLAVGLATLPCVQHRGLRRFWVGASVLAACLPDVAEWKLRLAGITLPHNALASPPVALAVGVVLVLGCRLRLRERSPLVVLALPAALASHGLLDGIDGGIPWLWPLSGHEFGVDWLHLSAWGGGWPRLIFETILFAPLVILALAALRFGSRRRRGAGASGPSETWGAWASGPSLHSLGITGRRPMLPGSDHFLQLVPVLPVLIFSVAQLYAERQFHVGMAALRTDDARAAQIALRECLRWQPLERSDEALYYLGECHWRSGDPAAAARLYAQASATNPGNPIFRFGLAQVYLNARDTAYHRPAEGVRLLEQVHSESPPGAYRDMVARALDAARSRADARP